MDPRLEKFFTKPHHWQAESQELRRILLDCGLTEEFKWGKPCYAFDGSNLAIIQRMKPHLALMFFKGALLKDTGGVLKKPGENSRSGRRLEFTSVDEVVKAERVLRRFVRDAIRIDKAGLKVAKPTELVLVEELSRRLSREPALKAAFESLTPGRQRAYNLHFSGAKQASTREKRIENCAAKILSGKGFRD